MSDNISSFVPTAGHTPDADLAGYRVEAADGHVGKVDKQSRLVDSQYVLVDTGVWIFGRKVMLPAADITGVDHEEKKIVVARTKAEIKRSPEFDEGKHLGDPAHRDQLDGH
ncbi:PRC-barrel domain containing protein [Streptomyces avermitilis]